MNSYQLQNNDSFTDATLANERSERKLNPLA